MLTKTNTIRSSTSTLVTTSNPNVLDSNRSQKTKIKIKDKENTISSRSITDLIDCELIIIKKEKNYAKKYINLPEDRPHNKIDKKENTAFNTNKKHLKFKDENNKEVVVKSILKKSLHLRRPSLNNSGKDVNSFNTKKDVKFADEVNEVENLKGSSKVSFLKKPLAEVIIVESYRHHNIYQFKQFDEYVIEEKDEANSKAVCRCNCIVF